MKIQVIGYSKKKELDDTVITTSSLSAPKSLDEFDVNIIDLSSKYIWENKEDHYESINSINDFQSVGTMIENSRKTKIVYAFPENVCFRYYWDQYEKQYIYSKFLKDIIEECERILLAILPYDNAMRIDLLYEHTRTKISGKEYEADFYFSEEERSVAKSIGSEKVTVVELADRIWATTLDITTSSQQLNSFVEAVVVKKEKESVPEWINEVAYDDDCLQREKIDESKKLIMDEEKKIREAENKLEQNLHYKSILYTNGDELVKVVFEILEKILDCDLSGFVDVNREDFLIHREEKVFIGEIKGVTSNVKNEHISQVDVHYQRYMDELEAEGKQEDVKQILIINPLRNKPIDQREPIHENQIQLAERNGCLVIETNTLLRIYEKFSQNKLTSENCIKIFGEREGLLRTEILIEE